MQSLLISLSEPASPSRNLCGLPQAEQEVAEQDEALDPPASPHFGHPVGL